MLTSWFKASTKLSKDSLRRSKLVPKYAGLWAVWGFENGRLGVVVTSLLKQLSLTLKTCLLLEKVTPGKRGVGPSSSQPVGSWDSSWNCLRVSLTVLLTYSCSWGQVAQKAVQR